MGRNIGSLGREREPLDLEFDYFGTVVRVHPFATDAVEIEFLEAGKDVDYVELRDLDLTKFDALADEDQVRILTKLTSAQREGYKALMRSLRRLVHPDDFEAYWKLGNDRGQQVVDRMADIRAITSAVVELRTDFPTGPRSVSQSGPSGTPQSSAGALPSREVSDYEAGLALLRGRPDLQEFVVMQRESEELEARTKAEAEERDQASLRRAGLA